MGGKARRVYLLLRDQILGGELSAGVALPGEQTLSTRLGVSRVTVRRALATLAAEGLVETHVGSGTTVRPVAETPTYAADFTSLMPQLVEMEQRTEARLLSFAYTRPVASVAKALGLGAEARVQTATRVRLIDGQPFSHLTTHVPEAIAQSYSEADLATTPLFRLLERSGVKIAAAEQSVTATLAAPQVAEALEVAVGSALLSLTRIVRDAEGRGVEHLSALYRPDRFRLEMALDRVGSGDNRHWAPVVSVEAAE